MKAYLLARTERIGYDEYDSFVVVAESPEAARQLVADSKMVGDEGADTWLAPVVEVTEIPLDKAAIILGSFNAG